MHLRVSKHTGFVAWAFLFLLLALDVVSKAQTPVPSCFPGDVTCQGVSADVYGMRLRKMYFLQAENQSIFELENGQWQGVPVTHVVHETIPAGQYEVTWDANQKKFTFPIVDSESKKDTTMYRWPYPPGVILEDGHTYPTLVADGHKTKWNGRHLVANPNQPEVLTKTKVVYSLAGEDQTKAGPAQDTEFVWKVYANPQAAPSLHTPDPFSGEFANPVIWEGYGPQFEVTWEKPDRYCIKLLLRERFGPERKVRETEYVYWQDVLDEEGMLNQSFARTSVHALENYIVYLTSHQLQQSHLGEQEQNFGENPIVMKTSNPGLTKESNRSFSLTSQPAGRIHWYARHTGGLDVNQQIATCGSQQVASVDQPTFDLGTSPTAPFACALPGEWDVFCEVQEDPTKEPRVISTYRLWVTDQEQIKRVERLRTFVKNAIKEIKTRIVSGTDVPLKAAYINRESKEVIPLALYAGQTADKKYVLLDLLPGVQRMVYEGNTFADAVVAFERGNSYPKGSLRLQMAEGNVLNLPRFDRILHTQGESTYAKWSRYTGWLAFGTFVLGATLSAFPLTAPAGGAVLTLSAGLGAVSASLSLYDHLHQEEIAIIDVSIDILGIVTSLLNAGTFLKAIKGNPAAVLTTKTGRTFVFMSLGTANMAGILVSYQAVDQLIDVIDSNLPKGQKIEAIAKTVALLTFQGLLMTLSVKGVTQAKSRIGNILGAEGLAALSTDEIYLLNMLKDDALAHVPQLNDAQNKNLLLCLRAHPDLAAQLMKHVQGRELLNQPLAFQKKGVQILGFLNLQSVLVVELAQKEVLDSYVQLAKTWSVRFGETETQNLLERIGWAHLKELSAVEIQQLEQATAVKLGSLITDLEQLEHARVADLRQILHQQANVQRVTAVFGENWAANFATAEMGELSQLSTSVLTKLQQTGNTEMVRRGLRLWRAFPRHALTLFHLEESKALLKAPFSLGKGAIELPLGIRATPAFLIELARQNKLASLLLALEALPNQFGTGPSKDLMGRLSNAVLAQVGNDLAGLLVDFEKTTLDPLLRQLPSRRAVVASLEELFEHWAKALEPLDNGHYVSRHGSQLSLADLRTRIITGLILEGGGFKFSPTRYSTRFGSARDLVLTRREALRIMQTEGLDIKNPPTFKTEFETLIQYSSPIGDGFVGTGPQKSLTFNGKNGIGYNTVDQVSGLKRVYTKVIWNDKANGGKGNWEVIQHFPVAKDWDQLKQTYLPSKEKIEIFNSKILDGKIVKE